MSKPKPIYSIDAPDQPRLKVARLEIEAVLAKHDLAGVVVLHTPGMAEFFYNIRPTYSVCWVDEQAQVLRLKSKRDRDHGGDTALQLHDQTATANMAAALASELANAAVMFEGIETVVSKALTATHSAPTFVADASEVRPS